MVFPKAIVGLAQKHRVVSIERIVEIRLVDDEGGGLNINMARRPSLRWPASARMLRTHPSARLSQAERDALVDFADKVAALAATIPAGGLPTVYVHRAILRVVASIDTDN